MTTRSETRQARRCPQISPCRRPAPKARKGWPAPGPRALGASDVLGDADGRRRRMLRPSNCGSQRRAASSISEAISRISRSVNLAEVSGSRAQACTTRSGSALQRRLHGRRCTLMLGGSAPRTGGKVPHVRLVQACTVHVVGALGAASAGRLAIIPPLMTLPFSRKVRPVTMASMMYEPYSTLRAAARVGSSARTSRPRSGPHRLAPLVVGARCATERPARRSRCSGPPALAEVGQVLREVPGALGHQVAEMPEHLAANLLVHIVLGLFEALARRGTGRAPGAPSAGTKPCG